MSCIILRGQTWKERRGAGVVGGAVSFFCSHSRLSRRSRGYLLFLVCERGDWHFPLAVEAHRAVPSAPVISRGLLSWNGTKLAGAYGDSRGSSRRAACEGFADRRAAVLWDCDRLRRLVDHLITYIYTGNRSMKVIIFEASRRVKTFPCFHSTHSYRLKKSNITAAWREMYGSMLLWTVLLNGINVSPPHDLVFYY